MATAMRVPSGVPTARFQAPKMMEMPDGAQVPLIDPNDPNEKKLQERLMAQIKVFDLSKPEDVIACQAVWQQVADGLAVVSEHRTDLVNGGYLTYLRWAVFTYQLPERK